MVRIGVQTSISGGIHKAVERQKEKTGNCGQVFSHSPQSWSEPSITNEESSKFQDLCSDNDINPWVVHTSYLVNLCSPRDDLRRKSIDSVQTDLEVADRLNMKYVNTHLGAHTGAGEEKGIQNAIESINQLNIPDGVELLIETDSGSGTNLGSKFDQLQVLQEKTENKIGFCIDTAHIWAAGYDLTTEKSVDSVFQTVDKTIGIENVKLFHMNDSKHDMGTNRDEHQHLGEGEIGYEGISSVVDVAGRNNIPMIAETPITDEKGDPWNLNRVRSMWSESKD